MHTTSSRTAKGAGAGFRQQSTGQSVPRGQGCEGRGTRGFGGGGGGYQVSAARPRARPHILLRCFASKCCGRHSAEAACSPSLLFVSSLSAVHVMCLNTGKMVFRLRGGRGGRGQVSEAHKKGQEERARCRRHN